MKTLIAALVIVFLLVTAAFAEKVKTIDTTGWTQDQKNRAKAALVYGLANAGRSERPEIKKTGVNEYTLIFPDTIPNGVFNGINSQTILNQIKSIDTENEAIEAAKQSQLRDIASSIRSKLTSNTHQAWTDEEVNILFSGIRAALNY